MSDYTTQIRWLRSSNFQFGLNDYPIFDENYRETLNQKILDHYQFREIGFETAGMFRHYLRTTMIEIMPKYNKIYLLLLNGNDLFNNTNMTEDYLRKNDGKSVTVADGTGESSANDSKVQLTTDENNAKSKLVSSDTPQSFLNSDEINANRYASKAELSNGDNKGSTNTEAESESSAKSSFKNNGENTVDNVENYLRHLKGNNGGMYNYQMIYDLKNKMVDIDLMIIDDLSNLFMLIY